VHAQHEQHFHCLARRQDEEPRSAFYTNLLAEVTAWKAQGDQIVIGINANKDIRHGGTAKIFADMDMREVITDAHRHRDPPATYDKNTSHSPIDGSLPHLEYM
jgi:hypothetical protein